MAPGDAVLSRTAAVCFDMDGLLIDSEPLWTVAEIELADSLGGRWTNDIKAEVVGTRLDVAVPLILAWYGATTDPAAVERASSFLQSRMVDLFHEALPLMPGALELVDAVRDRGVPTALVSSSYRVLVDAALDTIGADRFDVTLAGDEVVHGKPSPEPYLRACQSLDVSPRRVVIIEDAPSGVEAGEAAGATVIAVPSVTAIPAAPGRVVVSSLTEIDPDWLVHQAVAAAVSHG